MRFRCIPCDRSFDSDKSLKQHKQTSPAHDFKCAPCARRFDSETALQQHLQNSPAHAPSFDCNDCNRSFTSEGALQQHIRDSASHTLSFDCGKCSRSFASNDALQQHIQDSPAHASAPSFGCNDCNILFDSDDALEQHLRESPAHTSSFECNDCVRSFTSEEALQQHLRDSPNHQEDTETPLDAFFHSFPTFHYDPSLSPATSYASLRRHEGWRRGNSAADIAWNSYQDALQSELKMWYGSESNLTAWHVLCRAIGVESLPKTCEQCEQVVRRMHVNIIDLIEWGRSGSEEKVQTFRGLPELRAYTKETGKIFHNTLDQESGNVVLRHLLRKIF